jgi:phasin family protein
MANPPKTTKQASDTALAKKAISAAASKLRPAAPALPVPVEAHLPEPPHLAAHLGGGAPAFPAEPESVTPPAAPVFAAPMAGLPEAAAPAAAEAPAPALATLPAPAAEPLPAATTAIAAKTRTALETNMDQMTRTTEGLYKATEDAVEFNRGNLEAFTKATQTYMSGLQDLSKQAFALMQSMGEQSVQNAKALASVKSVKEAAELQTSFVKSSLETSVAEATRLNEAAFKLAEQSSAPIAARMTLAMEKFGRPASFI